MELYATLTAWIRPERLPYVGDNILIIPAMKVP